MTSGRAGRRAGWWVSGWADGSVDRWVGRQALAEAEIRDRATHTGPQGPALQNVVPTTLLLEIAKMLSCLSWRQSRRLQIRSVGGLTAMSHSDWLRICSSSSSSDMHATKRVSRPSPHVTEHCLWKDKQYSQHIVANHAKHFFRPDLNCIPACVKQFEEFASYWRLWKVLPGTLANNWFHGRKISNLQNDVTQRLMQKRWRYRMRI